MIYDVKNIGENVYLINNSIKISNIDFDLDGVRYDIDYNQEDLTEDEASEICNRFILEAIDAFLEKDGDE